jgi:hypothetical protein
LASRRRPPQNAALSAPSRAHPLFHARIHRPPSHNAGYPDAHAAAEDLLLKHLSRRGAGAPPPPAAAAARRFWQARAFAEDAAAAARRDPDAAAAAAPAALAAALRRREELASLAYDTGLTPGDARRLARWALLASLARARAALLTWLLEMMDPARQAPLVRARAAKALGELVAAAPGLVAAPAVRAAVERALGDEAISVRDAALALVGRHMGGDRELAAQLVDVVIRAAEGEPQPACFVLCAGPPRRLFCFFFAFFFLVCARMGAFLCWVRLRA